MKKHLSWVLDLLLFVALCSPSPAFARHHRNQVTGQVIAAEKTTITIQLSHRSTTFDVPTGTPINGGESDSVLTDLIGKTVTVKEKSPNVAKEIIVKGGKSGKKNKNKSANS